METECALFYLIAAFHRRTEANTLETVGRQELHDGPCGETGVVCCSSNAGI